MTYFGMTDLDIDDEGGAFYEVAPFTRWHLLRGGAFYGWCLLQRDAFYKVAPFTK